MVVLKYIFAILVTLPVALLGRYLMDRFAEETVSRRNGKE